MISNYIKQKSKYLIAMNSFAKLNELLIRLQKRESKSDLTILFWCLDNEIECCRSTWERVYQIFKQNCILFPIVIRRIYPKADP